MDRYLWVILGVVLLWLLFAPQPKARWEGARVTEAPIQVSDGLPAPWTRGRMTFTPKARYEIRAVILSKHHYWAGFREDRIAPYDLALGWGPMSDAAVINALHISQGYRWYQYSWDREPPIDPSDIVRHSSNHHVIPADSKILKKIKSLRRLDRVVLKGFLVEVSLPDGWRWTTSLTREDSGGGSCEVLWAESVERVTGP